MIFVENEWRKKLLILNVLCFAVKQYGWWEFISGNNTTRESLVLAVIAAICFGIASCMKVGSDRKQVLAVGESQSAATRLVYFPSAVHWVPSMINVLPVTTNVSFVESQVIGSVSASLLKETIASLTYTKKVDLASSSHSSNNSNNNKRLSLRQYGPFFVQHPVKKPKTKRSAMLK